MPHLEGVGRVFLLEGASAGPENREQSTTSPREAVLILEFADKQLSMVYNP